MPNFDCLSCEHGDKCTLYMATGITRCNDYKKKKTEIVEEPLTSDYCPDCGAKMDGGFDNG